MGSHVHVCCILTNDMSSGSKGMPQKHCHVCVGGGWMRGDGIVCRGGSESRSKESEHAGIRGFKGQLGGNAWKTTKVHTYWTRTVSNNIILSF